MPRLNNILKFALLNINIVLSFVGVALFGFSFYLWFANWGKLETGFFVGSGVIIMLFGIAIILISCLGCQGMDNQTGKYGNEQKVWKLSDHSFYFLPGWVTGRKILTTYQLLLIGGLVGELLILQISLQYVHQFQNVIIQLNQNIDAPYVEIESTIQSKFNPFFYGASSGCKGNIT